MKSRGGASQTRGRSNEGLACRDLGIYIYEGGPYIYLGEDGNSMSVLRAYTASCLRQEVMNLGVDCVNEPI